MPPSLRALALGAAAALVACGGSSSAPGGSRSGPAVTSIDLGHSHACAVKTDGALWCWGNNFDGQLGTRAVTSGGADSYSPDSVEVQSVSAVQVVAAGAGSSCALAGGALQCWGDNGGGEVKGTPGGIVLDPFQVSSLPGPTAAAMGDEHACAIVSGGRVKCWGTNATGQLGDGTTTARIEPVYVGPLEGAVAVSVGRVAPNKGTSCALLAEGTVRCWGSNAWAQLGTRSVAFDAYTADPVTVTSLSGATTIAVGQAFACALLADGKVNCWGRNVYGEVAQPSAVAWSGDPVEIPGVAGATALAAGGYHACAIVGGGAVKCWGSNSLGQLGNGSTTGAVPNGLGYGVEDVQNLTGAVRIAAGELFTCAVLASGGVKCWGDNRKGQLGDGGTTDSSTPVDVRF